MQNELVWGGLITWGDAEVWTPPQRGASSACEWGERVALPSESIRKIFRDFRIFISLNILTSSCKKKCSVNWKAKCALVHLPTILHSQNYFGVLFQAQGKLEEYALRLYKICTTESQNNGMQPNALIIVLVLGRICTKVSDREN